MLSDYEGDIAVVGLGVGGVCGEEGIRNGEERVKDWGGKGGRREGGWNGDQSGVLIDREKIVMGYSSLMHESRRAEITGIVRRDSASRQSKLYSHRTER